jgi:hypothetical protein
MRVKGPRPNRARLHLRTGQHYIAHVLSTTAGGQTTLRIDGTPLMVASHSRLKVGDVLRLRVERRHPHVVFKVMARKNEREQDFEVRV